MEAILAALGLSLCDLFPGPPPSPQQAVVLRAAQEAREREAKARRKARLDALIRVEKLQAVVNKLGAKLANSLDDGDYLATLFHRACERLHEAETEVERFYPVRRVSAQDRN